MIISHTHRFIFIKTRKTADTSLELALARLCSEQDIVTPIVPPEQDHYPRNWRGFPNLGREIRALPRAAWLKSAKDFITRRRFVNHLSASVVRLRVPDRVWRDYFKFCFERDPFDKVASQYVLQKQRQRFGGSIEQFLDGGLGCINAPLYSTDCNLLVDYVAKYENIHAELEHIGTMLGISLLLDAGRRAKATDPRERSTVAARLRREYRSKMLALFSCERETLGADHRFAGYWEFGSDMVETSGC